MKINKLFAIGVLLTTLLLCAPTAYAQDVTVSKPTKNSTTTNHTINKPSKNTTTKKTTSTSTTTSASSTTTKNNTTSSSSQVQTKKPTTGIINGHEWVDLGLSVKWATCNVGASSPSDYGNYYAWGETSTKSSYTSDNSITYGKNMGSIAGSSQYDVARANWGATWRLPTKAEIDELVNKCKREWTTQGGHNGYKVTGPNGNSIFLPAAGWRNGTSLYNAGEFGYYWSATPGEDDTIGAYGLYFYSSYFYRYWDGRYYGRSVRPVSE